MKRVSRLHFYIAKDIDNIISVTVFSMPNDDKNSCVSKAIIH